MVTVRQIFTRALLALFIINLLTTSVLSTIIMYLCHVFLSKRSTQIVSCYVSWIMANETVFIGSWLCNIRIITYGSDKDADMLSRSNYIINMNHRYELDFMTAWIVGAVFDLVKGAKVCLKEELRRVPILGKVWEEMGYIFLEREWSKDKVNLDRACAVLRDYPLNFVVLIFCEGTRFTEAKLESSNDYARKHGLKELKYHLIPRTRGFLYMVESLRSSIDAIYDCTIRMEGGKPSVLTMFSGADMTVHCHYRRFDIANIPSDPDDCSKWLYKLYEEKDDLVDGFVKNGYYPGKKVMREMPLCSLLISLLFLLFYTLPTIYGIVSAILSLPPLALYVAMTGLVITCVAVCYKIWGYTRMSKASTYGLGQTPQKSPKPNQITKSD